MEYNGINWTLEELSRFLGISKAGLYYRIKNKIPLDLEKHDSKLKGGISYEKICTSKAKKHKKECIVCGKIFWVGSKGKDNKTCSKECQYELVKSKLMRESWFQICPYCGKEFVLDRNQRWGQKRGQQAFCSITCSNKYKGARKHETAEKANGIVLVCCICGKEFRKGRARIRSGIEEERCYCSCECMHKDPEHIKRIIKKRMDNDIIHNKDSRLILNDKDMFISFVNEIPYKKRYGAYIGKILGYNKHTVSKKIHDYEIENMFPQDTHISVGEKDVVDFVKSLGIDIRENERKIVKFNELDIYIPSKKIAIEYNGEYWHNDKIKPRKYHYNKYLDCRKAGIQLIQIWESEWRNKEEQIKNLLKSKLGLDRTSIYARDCKILHGMPSRIVNEFLDQNHIQGADKHFRAIGLTHNGELVAVMTFRKSRNNKEVELSRYATSCRVVGGFTKLLSRCGLSGAIVSYSDNRLSDGGMYEKNGWELIKEMPMDYVVSYRGELFHKSVWRKERIRNKFPYIDFGDKTEWEMEDEVGALRCWDCGKKKWKIVL